MSIILFIIILAALILVHEFGHFIVAKRAGIRVDEFGIGFPPRLFGKKKGETIYSINWIPFGGFVKIFGENPNDESVNGPDKERSFVRKSRITQMAVIGAGIAFNLFFAWFLISVSFMSGLPAPVDAFPNYTLHNPEVVVTSIHENSPAGEAGFLRGDVITHLSRGEESVSVTAITDVQEFITAQGVNPVSVQFERSGALQEVTLTPVTGLVLDRPAIGIAMDMVGTIRLPVHQAVVEGGKTTFEIVGKMALGFTTLVGDAFRGDANLSQISGPVGIVGLVGDAASFGFVYLLGFTAFISINLAILNLIPFPALDGGRLLFILIEAIKRSPISPKFANAANAIGFVMLILLMLVVTYSDIAKLL